MINNLQMEIIEINFALKGPLYMQVVMKTNILTNVFNRKP